MQKITSIEALAVKMHAAEEKQKKEKLMNRIKSAKEEQAKKEQNNLK